jgi:hypothetical protein
MDQSAFVPRNTPDRLRSDGLSVAGGSRAWPISAGDKDGHDDTALRDRPPTSTCASCRSQTHPAGMPSQSLQLKGDPAIRSGLF